MSKNINFYKVIDKKYLKPLAEYDNFKEIQIPLPVRIALCGSSGTGKTNAILNIISQFNAFTKFFLFVGDSHESLYKFLIDYVKETFGPKSIMVYNNLDEVPLVSEFDDRENNLVIIDDLINEKNNSQKDALNLFTNGRKANISIINVSQDYFKINLTVRKNCQVTIMTRFDDETDLVRILNKFKRSYTSQEIRNLYDYATDGGLENFFLVDSQGRGEWRFRRNFEPIG
jgi:hypothetical protein